MSGGRLGAVLACAVALLLSACGGIPAVGPVTDGPRLDQNQAAGVIVPAGPQVGADPEGIVRGFIAAGGGFGEEHKVARSYLVSSVQTRWRPDARVVVYPSPGRLEFRTAGGDTPDASTASEADPPGTVPSSPARAEGRSSGAVTDDAQPARTVVRVTVPVTATVDEAGALVNGGAGQTVTLEFTLEYSSGLGWRISRLDDGILLSDEDFRFTYNEVALYFPDRTGAYLVPDLRWFPATVQGSTATRAVRELLEGPTAWLDPAVTSGFPLGTEFAAKNVTVEDGEATVDVTQHVLFADEKQRKLLLAQLAATLSGLNSVIERVRITVKQAEFARGDALFSALTGPTLVRRTPSEGTRPVAVTSTGRLVRITPRGAEPLKGLEALDAVHGTRPAVSPDESRFAVLSAARDRLYVADRVGGPRRGGADAAPGTISKGGGGDDAATPGSTAALSPVTGTDLVAPSFDPQGWVWTASRDGSGRLIATDGELVARPSAGWLVGARVSGLRLSRDGSRVALAVRQGSRGTVLVAGVVRDDAGRPLRLTDPYEVVPDLVESRAVAWTGEATLVVLGRRSGQAEQPTVVRIGGQPEGTLPVARGRSLAANQVLPGSPLDVYVGTSAGKVLKRQGSRWITVAEARWPALPG